MQTLSRFCCTTALKMSCHGLLLTKDSLFACFFFVTPKQNFSKAFEKTLAPILIFYSLSFGEMKTLNKVRNKDLK